MQYKVIFTERALKQLKKLDKSISSLILGWLDKNIEGCENPRLHGKGLVENRSRTMALSYRWLSNNM